MLRDDDPALAPLLRRRGGVVLPEDLVAAGLDRRLLDRRTASGVWTRVAPSVAVASRRPTLEQQCLAAVAHAGTPSGVTGLAACVLHGLRDVPAQQAVDVLVLHRRRLVSTPLVVVRRTTVATRLVRVRGVPAVPVARAARDACSTVPRLQDVRALVLAAVADGHVELSALEQELVGSGTSGRSRLTRTLADARRGNASAPEAEFADLVLPLVRSLGLTLLLNPWLLRDGRVLLRPDAYVPELGRGFEVDSVEHHGDGPALTSTLARHDRAQDHGVLLRHVTPWQLRTSPRLVLERVRTHLATGSRPPDLVVRRHDDPPPGLSRRRSA